VNEKQMIKVQRTVSEEWPEPKFNPVAGHVEVYATSGSLVCFFCGTWSWSCCIPQEVRAFAEKLWAANRTQAPDEYMELDGRVVRARKPTRNSVEIESNGIWRQISLSFCSNGLRAWHRANYQLADDEAWSDGGYVFTMAKCEARLPDGTTCVISNATLPQFTEPSQKARAERFLSQRHDAPVISYTVKFCDGSLVEGLTNEGAHTILSNCTKPALILLSTISFS
jgi:hypothetical protein